MGILAAGSYTFDWSVVWDNSGLLLRALKITFEISIVAEIISLVVGLLIAILRVQKAAPAAVARDRVHRFLPRGAPAGTAHLALLRRHDHHRPQLQRVPGRRHRIGVLYGANLAEIFRAGLEAVPVGQREAALTLGLSRRQALQSVVLPQAIRISIPPLGNMWIGVMKDSTLVSILGIQEIMRTAQNVVLTNFRPFEIYTTVAAIYLGLVFIFSRLIAILERRMPLR